MRLLKEPLLHFLLAGGLLFAAYTWLNRGSAEDRRVANITAAEVTWLKESWARQNLRPPSEQEVRGLVTDYLKESLLAREAQELGLGENDTIVRRRLAQKMEFLVQDTARLAEPGEDVLRQFHAANQAKYQTPGRVSFTQLLFKTEAAAQGALGELKTRNAADLGDPSTLERDFSQVDEPAVASVFGPELAGKVFSLAPGQWHGPLASSYGFHLVRVDAQQAAQARPFEQVRAQVLDEWYRVQQDKASQQFFAGLLKKYDVVVEDKLKPLIGPLSGNMQ
ncbi:MAG: peptidylprolyl isomerase [Sulfuricellaceae bacterium]|nr:peptidylprolyl isomerase [Sulfuricellaceae bacterium]